VASAFHDFEHQQWGDAVDAYHSGSRAAGLGEPARLIGDRTVGFD